MNIEKKVFGQHQGKDVDLYTLSNDNGMVVKIMTYGATITTISIPNKNKETVNIACGFDQFDGYFSEAYVGNSPYYGCTVGRYSSQIKDAKFTLNGKEYQLATNCGANNLHGGTVGFDKQVWSAQITETNGTKKLVLSLKSKDMEEGYPGNVEAAVSFELNNNNEIVINYLATTDKPTPLSLTNHTYFNLSAFKNTVENHTVLVNTATRLKLDETGAATGIIDVTDSIDDLRKGRKVADVHTAIGDGFEHFYTFDNPACALNKVAEVSDAESGRKLEVSTTEPCMLFYTGKYTSDDLVRENGDQFGKYRGFCCETHRYPNGPNLANSPMSITTPEKPFTSTTIFKLTF